MAVHRYWRLQINAAASGNIVGVRTLELRATVGGANMAVTGNGTPSASSANASYPVAQAFDATASTDWISTGGMPQWLQWDFGAGNERDVAQVAISNPYANAYGMLHGQIQYSDDGTNFTFWGFIGSPNTAAGAGNTYLQVPQGTGTLNAVLQPFFASGLSGDNANVVLPMPVTAGRFGGAGTGFLKSLTANGAAGANASFLIGAITAAGAGHASDGENGASVTISNFSASGYFGSNAAGFFSIQASGSGTVTNTGSAEIRLPAQTLTASGRISTSGAAAVSLGLFKAAGYFGSVLDVTIGGKFQVASTITAGGVGKAAAVLPLLEVRATGTRRNSISADITLPALGVAPSGNAWIVLPGFQLTAIGSATVAVTYEAYALNLNHRPRNNETPVDELTHYTNFPFDKIVRYKNSYFGVNSTGLYLLEGTTDDGAAIGWDVKTCMTDFGSSYLKTVTNAYFGGRLGEAASVSLHVGEAGTETYSYTTPLGDDAQNYRQTFGKGVKNRYYALELQGSGAFTLDSMTLLVSELSRRI